MYARSETVLSVAVAVIALACMVAAGCSCGADYPAVPIAEREMAPVSHPPRPCDSRDFILPESTLADSKVVTLEEISEACRAVLGGITNPESWYTHTLSLTNSWRARSQDPSYEICFGSGRATITSSTQLSLNLSLVQDTIAYGDPVPFRLTITNRSNQPIIFLRPRSISLGGYAATDLFVGLVSPTGTSVGPSWKGTSDSFDGFLPTRESYSVLPPGEACTVDLQFEWYTVRPRLDGPIPGGGYWMQVSMLGSGGGPMKGPREWYDVGTWKGLTKPSNKVLLTIRPPE